MHRDLYLEALKRIGELELDGRSLQNLISCMRDMNVTMVRHRISSCLKSCVFNDKYISNEYVWVGANRPL